MEGKDILILLKSSDMPVAHNVFLKSQQAPYLIYRDDEFEIITANSKAVLTKKQIKIELYSRATEVESCEEIVENLLNTFTTYSKGRSFDDNQQLYVTYYFFYIC